MSDVIEIDYMTDPPTITERSYTKAELEQREADIMAEQTQEAQEAAKAKATEDAIKHAKSLGFTDQMITVMYPSLGVANV